ncbi:transcription factor ATOH8 [Hyla sarda]|uniref:transcription factor ATOH8 n=1 Tax=Hyla sarda TaxID=327740 RepID=UPI0024C40378|nr:transcription factor ATOH8 [Hyla sarda]
MRNLQILQEDPQWKSHCLKDIKRLKRKNRELLKQVNGYQTFKVDLGDHHIKGESAAAQEKSASSMMDNSEGALDLSSGVLPGKKGLMPPATATASPTGLEIGEQRVQSRVVVCHRPPETSYLSVTYNNNNNISPEPCASPRKRLGETAEIKAIQQTRRLLANARERTRVHTISAAFEALRKQVPCYSYGQKLSKLAILRIACNYILSLARLADLDYSADHSNLSFTECVEQCTRTLQSEGRSKKRKE